jgi:hypothetical protein
VVERVKDLEVESPPLRVTVAETVTTLSAGEQEGGVHIT